HDNNSKNNNQNNDNNENQNNKKTQVTMKELSDSYKKNTDYRFATYGCSGGYCVNDFSNLNELLTEDNKRNIWLTTFTITDDDLCDKLNEEEYPPVCYTSASKYENWAYELYGITNVKEYLKEYYIKIDEFEGYLSPEGLGDGRTLNIIADVKQEGKIATVIIYQLDMKGRDFYDIEDRDYDLDEIYDICTIIDTKWEKLDSDNYRFISKKSTILKANPDDLYEE
ncbi:MAG: hypothetical protein GX758_04555, partial [Tenericutes bacterium]|nr:hypothetical protein [Mycoplasmatota bacterium]